MKLFENEDIHISKIYTVRQYSSKELFVEHTLLRYNVNLFCYELIYYLKGENLVQFGKVRLRDCPASIRFLPKGVTEGEYIVEKLASGDCIDVYFDTQDPMPAEALCLYDVTEARHLFLKLNRIWNDKKEGYYAQSMSILYEIIACIKQHTATYFTSEQGRKIRPAVDYMTEHLGDPDFDYIAMCGTTGLSYNHFKKLFISQFGQPPVKRLTALRMERARELIITGQYSITEIAEACGFENVYYFSSVFKKHFGVSPRKYSL